MNFNGRESVPPVDVAQVEDEDSREEEEWALEEELAERGLYRGEQLMSFHSSNEI